MKYQEILQSASDIVQDRGLNDYGHPADNMQHAAMLISAYLQMPVMDYQVCAILALVKLARATTGNLDKADNYIDGAAYIALMGQLATEENELYV
jgi:hypothetical protein